jgi:hypothetical protein
MDSMGGYQMQALELLELLEAELPPLDKTQLRTMDMPQDLTITGILDDTINPSRCDSSDLGQPMRTRVKLQRIMCRHSTCPVS